MVGDDGQRCGGPAARQCRRPPLPGNSIARHDDTDSLAAVPGSASAPGSQARRAQPACAAPPPTPGLAAIGSTSAAASRPGKPSMGQWRRLPPPMPPPSITIFLRSRHLRLSCPLQELLAAALSPTPGLLIGVAANTAVYVAGIKVRCRFPAVALLLSAHGHIPPSHDRQSCLQTAPTRHRCC